MFLKLNNVNSNPQVGGMRSWWTPQASTLIGSLRVQAAVGSIPTPSRHLFNYLKSNFKY